MNKLKAAGLAGAMSKESETPKSDEAKKMD